MFQQLFLYITWTLDPEIISLPKLSPRWYGLLFALAFYLGYAILRRIWVREGKTEKELDTFSWYIIIATILGARLGHVFFYGPLFNDAGTGYLQEPWSILNIREGGLASHGAAIGILLGIAVYRYFSKFDRSYWWIVDRLVIVVALGGALVRFGNFTNSEIIGKPTGTDKGVVFAYNSLQYLDYYIESEDENLLSYDFQELEGDTLIDDKPHKNYKVKLEYGGGADALKHFLNTRFNTAINRYDLSDRHLYFEPKSDYNISSSNQKSQVVVGVYGLPRHPSQLYEAACYILIFLFLFALYKKYAPNIPSGLLLGVYLSTVFTARFFLEFLKENQVSFEDDLQLNMGQNLSIPFVIVGLACIGFALTKAKKNQESKSQ